MLDAALQRLMARPLDRAGAALARRGITADQMTLIGFALGMGCAASIAFAAPVWLALLLLAAGRIADGLDGAIARATRPSDRGGYLDIVLDFVFYGAVPLAFAWRDPALALPAAALLFSFYVNGASFLAYAALAAKRGLGAAPTHGPKSIYFTAGLAEGTETIAVFAAMIIWPAHFALLAVLFAILCLITAGSRVAIAWSRFAGDGAPGGPSSGLEPGAPSATDPPDGTARKGNVYPSQV